MKLFKNTKGVAITEYLVLVGLVGVVIVGSVFGAGSTLRDRFLGFSGSIEAVESGPEDIGGQVLSGASDLVPDPFSLFSLSGEPLNALVSSDTVTLTGFDGDISVSVFGEGGPEVSVEGGPWVTTGIISPGESFRVRLTTAPTNDTTRLVTVDAGGVSDIWAVRTMPDLVPDPFSFSDLIDQPTNALTLSNSVTFSGFSAPVDISVSGDGAPQISVNGGEWAGFDVVGPGDEVRVRLTSSPSNDTTFSASITAGGVSDVWLVETMSDMIPDAFAFTDLSNQPVDTLTVSETLTLTGFSAPTLVSVSGDGAPQISVNGGPWVTSGTLAPGQSLSVRLTSSSTNDTTSVASIVAGGVASDWVVSTVQGCSNIGDTCADGTIYVGLSPDGNTPMYTTPTSDIFTRWHGGNWDYFLFTLQIHEENLGARSLTDGDANHAYIVNNKIVDDYFAFLACEDLNNSNYLGHADWYLPALLELNVLWSARNTGDLSGTFTFSEYWSSTEFDIDNAIVLYFTDGSQVNFSKLGSIGVRCVRKGE